MPDPLESPPPIATTTQVEGASVPRLPAGFMVPRPLCSPRLFYILGVIGCVLGAMWLIGLQVLNVVFWDAHLGSGSGLWYLLGGVTILIHAVLLTAMWSQVRAAEPRTRLHPVAIVGLLLVPVFNLYWLFPAMHGLCVRSNRHMRTRSILGTRSAPTLTFIACTLVAMCCVFAGMAWLTDRLDGVAGAARREYVEVVLGLFFAAAVITGGVGALLMVIAWWFMLAQAAAIARNIRHPSADQIVGAAPPTAPGAIAPPLQS